MSPMPLEVATRYAQKISTWLAPHCERLEIAGSIRRGRPECADVDIVCIPRATIYRDMFQVESGRQNHLWQFLLNYVHTYKPDYSQAFDSSPGKDAFHSVPKILSGEQPGGMQMILQLPKCQLDLWFTDTASFASRLLQRTGSKEHNVWFAERAQRYGLQWKPSTGLYQHTQSHARVPCATEADLYAALGLPYIEPVNREIDYLTQTFDRASASGKDAFHSVPN